MTLLAQVQAPEIDYKLLSPVFALVGGCIVVMMVGLFRSQFVRRSLVPGLTAATLLIAVGLTIWIWDPGDREPIIEGALAMDALTLGLSMLFYAAGLVTIVLSMRADAPRATGSMQFDGIASALGGDELSVTDPLLLTGIALAMTGLAFKASVAPFHQWTPDVYQGAPTPITTFMAVATKAAAFGILLRLFGEALGLAQLEWAPALAVLAATTIVIGNVGAIAQRSLKRLLAWSSVAQAGYLLAGVVVGTTLGLQATVFYLAVYLLMNVAAFAVVTARERVSEHGDDLLSIENLGRSEPWLAWSP